LKIEDNDSDDEVEGEGEIKHEGFLYKITQTKKLKKLWFKLSHKDLYCKNYLIKIINLQKN
jgi:hypothetical protein